MKRVIGEDPARAATSNPEDVRAGKQMLVPSVSEHPGAQRLTSSRA